MKLKFNYIFVFISFITLYIVSPIKVSAAVAFSIGKEASTYSNNIYNQERVSVGNCAVTNNTTLNDYINDCVREIYPIDNEFIHMSEQLGNGKVKYTSYFSGRIDVWGYNTSNGYMEWRGTQGNYNWIDYEGKKYSLYPGMRFVFRRYEPLESFVGEGMIENVIYSYNTGQLKLEGRSLKKLPNDLNNHYMSVSVDPNNFSIKNVALENKNGTWYVAFDVSIEQLRTAWDSNGGALLGVPGITAGHSSNTRGYHYFLPISIEIEILENRCLGINEFAKKYAENNPGTCCVEFPDTCDLCNSLEYAKANPGITKKCCEKFPETCCNITTTKDNQTWIGYANDDKIWVDNYKNKWQGNVCCNDINFASKHPGKCSGLILSTPTASKTCSGTKTDYFYTTSYTQYGSAGNHLARNVTCDLNGNGACSSSYTYTYTIRIDKKKNYNLNQVGYSYFDNTTVDDYNAYLAQRAKGNVTLVEETSGVKQDSEEGPPVEIPKTYKSNSLTKNNFSYKVSNPRIDPSDSSKYLIDITVTVYNLSKHWTDTPRGYDHDGTKVFFVPIKIALCWSPSGGVEKPSSNTCTNMEYAKNHVNECCGEETYFNNNRLICCGVSPYKDDTNKCPTNKEVKYTLDSNLGCNDGTKITNSFSGTAANTLITENISLETSKSPTVTSGTGFEFDINVTNNVVYTLNLSAGTSIGNAFASYDAYVTEYNNFKSVIYNSLDSSNNDYYIKKYNNNNQKIKFNVNSSLNPLETSVEYTNITEKKVPTTTSDGSQTIYFKHANYVCNSSYNSRTGITTYYWDGTPSSSGVLYSTCDSSNLNNPAIYYMTVSNTVYNVTYTYSMNLKTAYMDKNNVNIITRDDKRNNFNYINAGNKYYTKISNISGYYPFHITIKNGGITGNVNSYINDPSSPAYSCSYRVLNCSIEGVCPEDTPCDPSVEVCERGDCDPLTDPTCPPGPTPGTPNHYFRPISLKTPFPDREAGPNWFEYKNGNSYTYITTDEEGNDKEENVYTRKPMYEITLTNDMINQIKKFNKANPDYSDFNTMISVATNNETGNSGICKKGLCRQSLFLNYLSYGGYGGLELGGMNINSKPLKFNNLVNRFYRIGDFSTLGGGE